MATASSFKVQCPSCEAMVPVRDPGLIGRKIDCPKCQYRFVVEDPGQDEEDEAPPARPGKKATGVTGKKPGGKPAAAGKGKPGARAADDDEDDESPAPKKKKAGGSSTLILGVGLAVVALGLLGVGA